MSDGVNGPPPIFRLCLPGTFPIGGTDFDPPYFNLLRDLARLPWPRIPQTAIHAMIRMAAERRKPQGRPLIVPESR